MSAAVLEVPVTTGTDDDDVRTHIIHAPDGNAEALVTEARIYGKEVTAVCGYRWVPARDPERHPLCERCVEAANVIIV